MNEAARTAVAPFGVDAASKTRPYRGLVVQRRERPGSRKAGRASARQADLDQRVVAEAFAGAPPLEPTVQPNLVRGMGPSPGESAKLGLAFAPKTVPMGPENGAAQGHLMILTANPKPGSYVLRIGGPKARVQGRLLQATSLPMSRPSTTIGAGLSLTHVALLVLAGVLVVAAGVLVAQRED